MHRSSHGTPRHARFGQASLGQPSLRGGPGLRGLRGLLGTSRLVAVLLALTIVPLAAGVADASASVTTNCGVNLRSSPTTTASIRKTVSANTIVTASASLMGGWYTADCPGYVSGSAWYKITAINGRSVSSLLGVSAVYAATRLFRLSSSGYSEGIDVSSWQGSIDFAKVKAAGKSFVVAKATEGSTWTDSTYARNKASAMANGLKFTGYHFARPGTNAGDAASEADHFAAVLGLKRGMLIPALDLEVSGGLSVSALQTWVKTFLTRVYLRTGVRAMIYSNASFWSTNMGNTSWFAANGYPVLWIAHWGTSSPSVPGSDWASKSWHVWQYSDCGKVSGISGCVDLDRVRGSDFSGVTW
ncbi:MAG TPA: glycoside hydrolase family 25 protein [Candidatus Limnocylindrales bacterium]|jgi:GH25 family lysozyme M1 (1,4-beta-N-acetylmuramidase)